MENVEIEVKGTKLVITVDLSKKIGLSKSKKTTVIASTQGNVGLPGKEDIKIGLNVYTK